MKMQDKIVINDYIENDPLSKENLDKTLETVDRFRLSFPNKSIWIYSGFVWKDIMKYEYGANYINNFNADALRQCIVSKCDVLVDGRYIDSQRDITLKWRGSSNQRVIDIKSTLEKGNIVLWAE